MRIYLAAKYSRRAELIGYARRLAKIGHEVKARWLSEDHDLPPGGDPATGLRFAEDDIEDCSLADCVISFTEEPGNPRAGRNRGGRHVEFGIALSLRRFSGFEGDGPRLIVVGWRENVFHYAPEVEYFKSFDAALKALRGAEPLGL